MASKLKKAVLSASIAVIAVAILYFLDLPPILDYFSTGVVVFLSVITVNKFVK